MSASFLPVEIFIHCLNTCTRTHSHATLHHVPYLPDLSATCMHAHLHTLMPHLHHDIAHTFIHAYLFIYTCRFSFIHSC